MEDLEKLLDELMSEVNSKIEEKVKEIEAKTGEDIDALTERAREISDETKTLTAHSFLATISVQIHSWCKENNANPRHVLIDLFDVF